MLNIVWLVQLITVLIIVGNQIIKSLQVLKCAFLLKQLLVASLVRDKV